MDKRKSLRLADKEYQFTVRIPLKLKFIIEKRLEGIGLNTLSEYIRHIIIKDTDGIEG